MNMVMLIWEKKFLFFICIWCKIVSQYFVWETFCEVHLIVFIN